MTQAEKIGKVVQILKQKISHLTTFELVDLAARIVEALDE